MSKPNQYVQGWAEFYKLKFKVTPDVLIPRPETELLVDAVISYINQLPTTPPITILDLGTGSGAIAIALAKHLPTFQVGTQIIATDVSKKALRVAKQNARLHQVENRIKFIQSNLLSALSDMPDIIVTNLPYIPHERVPYLDPSVKDFEPLIALDGGEDGFELYRKLFQQIAKFSLTPERCKLKLLVGEIDYTHGQLALDEVQKFFPEAQSEVKLDLAHKQRFLIIKFSV